MKLGREDSSEGSLDELGVRLLNIRDVDAKARLRVDALLSQLYQFFFAPTRQLVLERWRMRGTSGAGARWLKAISDDVLLFDFDEVVKYWRETKDYRAAKLLASRGDAEFLRDLMHELIKNCDEGWIVSRAMLKAGSFSEDCFEAIRNKFPASYAYLCAKVGRQLDPAEAMALIFDSNANGRSDETALIIWAFGQLGMWSTLEQLRLKSAQLRNEKLDRFLKLHKIETGG